VVPGDELLGLQRAFLYAGAPTVVCTRWEAHDLIALLVMDRFYSRLGQGVAPGIALRDAQVAVRELTEPELAALLERWEAEQSPLAAVLGEPAGAGQGVAELRSLVLREGAPSPEVSALRSAETLAGRPFADPLLWAPFMLIGRAG
jgi:CHAT domain-containing protein